MCLMKVKFVEADGGALVMENVLTLRQTANEVFLESLLDGAQTIPGAVVDSIDFNKGDARIALVADRQNAASPAEAS